jgi:hypothetical protein
MNTLTRVVIVRMMPMNTALQIAVSVTWFTVNPPGSRF